MKNVKVQGCRNSRKDGIDAFSLNRFSNLLALQRKKMEGWSDGDRGDERVDTEREEVTGDQRAGGAG